MGHSAVAFIIVIGVLVFIHEFGHFIVARLCGVGVQVFSLGFGPKILTKVRGRTEYCLSAIPLGGYVKMVGEEPGASVSPEDEKYSFNHKNLWRKSLIVAAGPTANFMLALFLFYLLFQFAGLYVYPPTVGRVLDGMPAKESGLRAGDIIKQINGQDITSFEQIAVIISKSDGSPLDIVIQRANDFVGVKVTPVSGDTEDEFGDATERYVIGIEGNGELIHQRFNPFEAFWEAIKATANVTRLTLLSIGKMITGSLSAKNLGGPLMIAQLAGQEAKAGIVDFLGFIALLSVNLGIINLFPIPVLDGGHLLFFLIEGVSGKSVSDGVREIFIRFGAAVLIALMIFVFYNDILRLFSGD